MKLRPFQLSDGEALCRWVADEVTFTRWCANLFSYPLTMAQLEQYSRDPGADSLAVTAEEDGVPMGHAVLRKRENDTVYFGFVVLAPEKRGQGLGREWIGLLARYCFETLGARQVTLDVFDNNPAAWRCYQHAGFRIVEEEPACFPFHEEKWGRYGMRLEKADCKP